MKVLCIYHSRDLDGWMSGAIVSKWFEENHTGPDRPDNHIYMSGWDYSDPVPNIDEMAGTFDKIVMCDVAFPGEDMAKLHETAKEFVWIDHHVSAINETDRAVRDRKLGPVAGLRHQKYAACELTWMYLYPEQKVPELVEMLGLYDSFRHKGTGLEDKVLRFQYAARAFITDWQEAKDALGDWGINHAVMFDNAGGYIYKYLIADAKVTYGTRNEITLDGKRIAVVSAARFNPVNFGIDYHKDGYDAFGCFWYEKGQWSWSLYNDNGEVDCSQMAKARGGGGHKGAAGFRCSHAELGDILGDNSLT